MSEDKLCALYLAWWPIVHEVGSSQTSQLKILTASITEKRDAPKNRKSYEGGILSAFSISGRDLLCLPWPVRLLQHFLAVGQGAYIFRTSGTAYCTTTFHPDLLTSGSPQCRCTRRLRCRAEMTE